jgi:hypothetical protein
MYGQQVIIGLIVLGLSSSLAVRWSGLRSNCGAGPYDEDCSTIVSGAGGMKYCVFVGVWILFDFALWALDACFNILPLWVVLASGNMTGGFAMGGGCVRFSSERWDVLC